MPLNLVQASEATGRSKSTVLRAIRRGLISAARDEVTGGWLIDPAELHRVYPPVAHGSAATANGAAQNRNGTDATGELREVRARLIDKDALIAAHERALDDLRRLLEEERVERRQATDRLVAAHAQIAALLTDQRPARRRWRFW